MKGQRNFKEWSLNLLEVGSNLLILFLFLAAAASHQGKIMGIPTAELFTARADTTEGMHAPLPTAQQLRNAGHAEAHLAPIKPGIWNITDDEGSPLGTITATLPYTHTIYGYAGNIPLLLTADNDGVLRHIELLPNDETPEFMESITESDLINSFIGKSWEEVALAEVEAVTGATMSSDAIIHSIRHTATLMQANDIVLATGGLHRLRWQQLMALMVIVSGIVISMVKKQKKQWRLLQLLLNTLVLGFFYGQFISMSLLLNWMTNGVNLTTSLVSITMLVTTFGMALFGKKNHHCNWVCPLGAAQELAGKLRPRKVTISARLMRSLRYMRQGILLLIFVLLWAGVGADVVNYEPFTAFLFRQANTLVLLLAGITLALSPFVNKPWCHFVCPTGQLLSWGTTRKFTRGAQRITSRRSTPQPPQGES